jgi:hypothetical protein
LSRKTPFLDIRTKKIKIVYTHFVGPFAFPSPILARLEDQIGNEPNN